MAHHAVSEFGAALAAYFPGAPEVVQAAIGAAVASAPPSGGPALGPLSLSLAAAAASAVGTPTPPAPLPADTLLSAALQIRAAVAGRPPGGPGDPTAPATAVAAAAALADAFISGAPLPPRLGGLPVSAGAGGFGGGNGRDGRGGGAVAFLPAVEAHTLAAALPYFIERRAAVRAEAEAAAAVAAARAAGGGGGVAGAGRSGPVPVSVPLPPPVAAWVAAGGPARLVASVAAAAAAGGTPPPGRCPLSGARLAGDLDFGTVPVTAAASGGGGGGAPSSSSSPWGATAPTPRVRAVTLALPPRPPPPVPPPLLLALGVLPPPAPSGRGRARTCPFSLTDDAGLAATGPSVVEGRDGGGRSTSGSSAVRLPHGSSYPLAALCSTTSTSASASHPHHPRRHHHADLGLVSADLFAVLAVPGVPDPLPPGTVRIPGGGGDGGDGGASSSSSFSWAASALGARTGAARLRPAAARALDAAPLSPGAEPWAPPALKRLFDAPAPAYLAAPVPWPVGGPLCGGPSLAAGAWWGWGGLGPAADGGRLPPGDGAAIGPWPPAPPPPPAASLRGVGAQRSLALSEPGLAALFCPAAARLLRLVAAEEAAAEAGAGAHDLFFAPAWWCSPAPAPGGVAVRAPRPGPADGGGGDTPAPGAPPPLVYRGPDLAALTGGSQDGAPDLRAGLLAIDVPGAPEGRPALALGDIVYLRPAGLAAAVPTSTPSGGVSDGRPPPSDLALLEANLGSAAGAEFAAPVVAVDGSAVFLLPPPALTAAVAAFAWAEGAKAAAARRAAPTRAAAATLPVPPRPAILFHARFGPPRAAAAAAVAALVDPVAGVMLPPPPPVYPSLTAAAAASPPASPPGTPPSGEHAAHVAATALPSEEDVLAAAWGAGAGAADARPAPPPLPPPLAPLPTLEAVARRAAALAASPPAGSTVLNEEQRLAVAGVLERPYGTDGGRAGRLAAWVAAAGGPGGSAASAWAATTRPPFVLAGPPGTGKTVTLVEAALQALASWPDARVLAAAPAPYAADRLAVALGAAASPALSTPGAILRAADPARPPAQAAPGALPFCALGPGGAAFRAPTRAEVAAARVVVASPAEAHLLLRRMIAQDEVDGGGGGGRG